MPHKIIFSLILFLSCMSNQELIDNCEFEGLANSCEVQLGQIKTLYYLRAEDDLTGSNCCDDEYLEQEDLSIKKGFVCLEFLPDQAAYIETTSSDAAGTLWKRRIEVKRQGTNADTLAELCRLTGSHTVFIADFYNGERRKLGSSENPFLFQATHKTGPAKKDLITQNIVFASEGRCPACLLDPSFEVPLLARGVPVAFMRVARSSTCVPVSVSTYPLSQRIDGSIIDTTTPGTQVQLVFTFGDQKNPYYEASIGPDGDPGDFADWTFIKGNRSSTQFQEEVVNQMISGSSAVAFNFNPQLMASRLTNINRMPITLKVVEFGLSSSPYTSSFLVGDNSTLRGTLTGSSFGFFYYSRQQCLVTVDFGDGNTQSQQVSEGVQAIFGHSYASSGTYNFEVISSASSLDMFVAPGQNLESLSSSTPKNQIGVFTVSNNNLGPEFSLRPFPFLRSFSAPSNSFEKIDFGTSPELRDITVSQNALDGTIDLSAFPELGQLFFEDNSIEGFVLGGTKLNLNILDLQNNNLDQVALGNIVDELFNFRGKTSAIVTFSGNPGLPLDQDALDKINGTGPYVNEGLVTQYGWTFHLVP